MSQLKELQDNPLPDSVKNAAQAAMADEASKPETTDKLLEEVRGLSDSLIKIDQAFQRVKIDLGKVDANDYKDENGNPVPRFQPTWIGYQQRFTALLWESRETATATEAYIKDFLEVIIPEVESIQNQDDYEDAAADLKEFVGRTDPFGKKLNSDETKDHAQKHSQAFTDLRRDLQEFEGTFKDFAKFHEGELNKEVARLQGEITRLDAEIKKCETIVTAMAIALGVTLFATAAGAVASLAAFGPVGPFVAIGVVIVGAIAAISELGVLIAYIVKGNEYRSERYDDQTKLEDLQAQLEVIKRLKSTLEAQKTDIDDICGRIDRISAIWAMVAHDAKLISEGLQAAISGAEGGASKKAFQRRVELVKVSYTALGTALGEYATQVDQSGIPK